jgi:hypothetical protein
MDEVNGFGDDEINDCAHTFKSFICGDEALRISLDEPYYVTGDFAPSAGWIT